MSLAAKIFVASEVFNCILTSVIIDSAQVIYANELLKGKRMPLPEGRKALTDQDMVVLLHNVADRFSKLAKANANKNND